MGWSDFIDGVEKGYEISSSYTKESIVIYIK